MIGRFDTLFPPMFLAIAIFTTSVANTAKASSSNQTPASPARMKIQIPDLTSLERNLISKPKLPLPNPRRHPYDCNESGHNGDPRLNVRYILVKGCICGGSDGGKRQDQCHITAGAVVFVNRLRIVDTAEYGWNVVLGDADYRLDEEEDVYNQTENIVRSAEVCAVVSELVIFNDDETTKQGQDSNSVDDRVHVGTFYFLLRRVGRLEEKDCLGAEEDTGQVKELGEEECRVSRISRGE